MIVAVVIHPADAEREHPLRLDHALEQVDLLGQPLLCEDSDGALRSHRLTLERKIGRHKSLHPRFQTLDHPAVHRRDIPLGVEQQAELAVRDGMFHAKRQPRSLGHHGFVQHHDQRPRVNIPALRCLKIQHLLIHIANLQKIFGKRSASQYFLPLSHSYLR